MGGCQLDVGGAAGAGRRLPAGCWVAARWMWVWVARRWCLAGGGQQEEVDACQVGAAPPGCWMLSPWLLPLFGLEHPLPLTLPHPAPPHALGCRRSVTGTPLAPDPGPPCPPLLPPPPACRAVGLPVCGVPAGGRPRLLRAPRRLQRQRARRLRRGPGDTHLRPLHLHPPRQQRAQGAREVRRWAGRAAGGPGGWTALHCAFLLALSSLWVQPAFLPAALHPLAPTALHRTAPHPRLSAQASSSPPAPAPLLQAAQQLARAAQRGDHGGGGGAGCPAGGGGQRGHRQRGQHQEPGQQHIHRGRGRACQPAQAAAQGLTTDRGSGARPLWRHACMGSRGTAGALLGGRGGAGPPRTACTQVLRRLTQLLPRAPDAA